MGKPMIIQLLELNWQDFLSKKFMILLSLIVQRAKGLMVVMGQKDKALQKL